MRTRPEEHRRDTLRVGTCSWKYDSWKGLVYDPETRYHAGDYLVDYGSRYDTVEVDQWFWSLFPGGVRLPDHRVVREYAQSVPDEFVFTVKAPNAITLTHFYARQPARHKDWANRVNEGFLDVERLGRFLSALEPIRSRLGPVMFQFEYLNKKKMPSRDAFLDRLDSFFDAAPAGYDYAVETRNPNYLSPEYFSFLRERKLGHVFLDGYYMPPPAEIAQRFDTHTAPFSVIRLHGAGRKEIEDRTGGEWNRVVEPRPDGIAGAVRIVVENAERGERTYLNVNNHFEGSAPLSIDRFLEALEGVSCD